MRPPMPDPVGPDQESVWDYPRPPAVRRDHRRVSIVFAGQTVVDSDDVVRVLETSHPPVFYLPLRAFAPGVLTDAAGSSWCEFKGQARYLDLRVGSRVAAGVAWNYPDPSPGYELLHDRVAVYAGPMDRVRVGGETVVPQPGGFYGGWITAEVVGPFKGVPGASGW